MSVMSAGVLVHNPCIFDWSRANHIFRNAPGHVNPTTPASRQRFVRLFETVGSNPNNRRPDAVQAGMITQQAANAGVEAYTRLMQNGEQIWVFVRNSIIINAGMNPPGAIR